MVSRLTCQVAGAPRLTNAVAARFALSSGSAVQSGRLRDEGHLPANKPVLLESSQRSLTAGSGLIQHHTLVSEKPVV